MRFADPSKLGQSGPGAYGTNPNLPARLTAIDGLRGIAALAVVLYHYSHFLRYGPGGIVTLGTSAIAPGGDLLELIYEQGHRAVPLFWMISGLVLAHVYYRRAATTREFVINRFARLYPLHLLTLMVVAGLQAVALGRLGSWQIYQNNDAWHFVLNLLFVSDWGLASGYSFNGPIWSVSVELIAYAMFWAFRKPLWRYPGVLPLAVSACALAVLAAMGDSNILRCVFYFFAGTTLAAIWRALAPQPRMLLALAGAMIAIGIAALVIAAPGLTQFVGLPGLFGGAILALSLTDLPEDGWPHTIAARLGDWSYGIYLWHFPVQLALIVVLVPKFDLSALASKGWFLGLYLSLVLLVAHFSFRHLEHPWRARLRNWGEAKSKG